MGDSLERRYQADTLYSVLCLLADTFCFMPAYAYVGDALERRRQGAAAQARRTTRVRVRTGGDCWVRGGLVLHFL